MKGADPDGEGADPERERWIQKGRDGSSYEGSRSREEGADPERQWQIQRARVGSRDGGGGSREEIGRSREGGG